MTDRTVSELKDDIIVLLDDAHTQTEVAEILHLDKRLVLDLMLDLAGTNRITIAPGTNGKKWMTTAKARRILKAQEVGE